MYLPDCNFGKLLDIGEVEKQNLLQGEASVIGNRSKMTKEMELVDKDLEGSIAKCFKEIL